MITGDSVGCTGASVGLMGGSVGCIGASVGTIEGIGDTVSITGGSVGCTGVLVGIKDGSVWSAQFGQLVHRWIVKEKNESLNLFFNMKNLLKN